MFMEFMRGTTRVSRMSSWRIPAVIAAVICGAMIASGCSSSSSLPISKMPPISTGTGTSSQQAALLTTSDLQAIPGTPAGVELAPPSQQGTLFQDPDPRSPCGARVTLPDFSQGAKIQFDSATFAAFQIVIDLPVSEATAFTTAWQRDTRPGCPPYKSLTNTGSSQTADLVASIPMPSLVDQATGAGMTITSNGQTVNSYGLILRSGGRLELDVLIAPAPLPDPLVKGFAQRAESKLKASLAAP